MDETNMYKNKCGPFVRDGADDKQNKCDRKFNNFRTYNGVVKNPVEHFQTRIIQILF